MAKFKIKTVMETTHFRQRTINYECYYAADEETIVGLRIIDPKSGETIKDMEGQTRTRRGNLFDFRDSDEVSKSERVYD
jgi:hypothetical protein